MVLVLLVFLYFSRINILWLLGVIEYLFKGVLVRWYFLFEMVFAWGRTHGLAKGGGHVQQFHSPILNRLVAHAETCSEVIHANDRYGISRILILFGLDFSWEKWKCQVLLV